MDSFDQILEWMIKMLRLILRTRYRKKVLTWNGTSTHHCHQPHSAPIHSRHQVLSVIIHHSRHQVLSAPIVLHSHQLLSVPCPTLVLHSQLEDLLSLIHHQILNSSKCYLALSAPHRNIPTAHNHIHISHSNHHTQHLDIHTCVTPQ
jgi:hypothetical protein